MLEEYNSAVLLLEIIIDAVPDGAQHIASFLHNVHLLMSERIVVQGLFGFDLRFAWKKDTI